MAAKTSSSLGQARVMLWCTPRSLSTVFCKSLSFIPDIDIFFDTYFFAYAAELNLELSGKVVDQDNDNLSYDDWRKAALMVCEDEDCSDDRINYDMLKYSKIKAMLDNPEPNKKVILCKGVSPSMDGKHFRFLPDKSSNYKHSFLLRHPAKLFRSWKIVLYGLLRDIGDGTGKKITKSLEDFDLRKDVPDKFNLTYVLYKELYDLWNHVRKNLDPNPVVMESDDLLTDPAGMLSKFCKAVGIPYSDSLLAWDASPDITDSWKCAFMPAKDFEFIHLFCHNAFHSSHFLPRPPVPALDELPEDVRELVEMSMSFYTEMSENRLLPEKA